MTIPSVDCILGDKLTAFAPHTTGIPFGIDKELEIIKQMYDVSCLFDVFENYQDIYDSYMSTVTSEIRYRGGNMTYEDSLNDTIEAAACIAGRGQVGTDYILLLSGIKKISTHIFDESFNAELAVVRAAKVMYTAACVLKNNPMIRITDIEKYYSVNISKSKYKKLGKIRKFDLTAFAYIVEAIRLIEPHLIIEM